MHVLAIEKEVPEEGAKDLVVGSIESASLEERVLQETAKPAGCVTALCTPWTKPRVGTCYGSEKR